MNDLERGGNLGPPFDDECCEGKDTSFGGTLEAMYEDLGSIGGAAPEDLEPPDLDVLEAELSGLEAGATEEDVDTLFEEAGDGLSLDEELEFVSAAADQEGADVGLEEILALVEKYPGLRISFSFA